MQLDHDRTARRARQLVATPSPTGAEGRAADLVAGWLEDCAPDRMERWDAAMADLERDPEYPGREVERPTVPVVAAEVQGRTPGPAIVLTGHLDTVPVGEAADWTRSPSGEVSEGRLYGRGACDMKAGLAAALEVFAGFAAFRPPRGVVRFVAVGGEEDGGTGTLAAIRRGWTGDGVVLTEPSSAGGVMQQVVAHGGALTFTITVRGRSAHGATRLEGVDALTHLDTVRRVLADMERRLNEDERRPLLRALGLPYPTNVGIVRGGTWASNVMDRVAVDLRAGVAVGESVTQAEERFAGGLLAGVAGDPWLAEHPPEIHRTGAAFASSAIDPDAPLAAAFRSGAAEVLGTAPPPAARPYGCDMALWVRVGGATTFVFGPGDVRSAHAPDEWVDLQEVRLATDAIAAGVATMLDAG